MIKRVIAIEDAVGMALGERQTYQESILDQLSFILQCEACVLHCYDDEEVMIMESLARRLALFIIGLVEEGRKGMEERENPKTVAHENPILYNCVNSVTIERALQSEMLCFGFLRSFMPVKLP